MDAFEINEEAALTLCERVTEAQRIAGNEMKTEKKRKKYKLGDKQEDGEEEVGEQLAGKRKNPRMHSFARKKRRN
jgi:hypothetical protein